MLQAGDHLGPYTVLRELGAGGMGVVYLAQHRHLGRQAAVKVLLPELSANEEIVRRFFTEAKATARIRHSGIVEILDCDITPSGRAYIVMEYLRGESLRARLQRVGDFSGDPPQAFRIAGHVAAALSAAHSHGIVHRDLKPDNVFLTPGTRADEPIIKILDFGIAKLISGESQSSTRSGAVLGTPLYMSPEQCRGARRVDHRTDIYSLGCMLFELLAGHPPFVREGSGDLLIAHATEPPPVLREVRPDVPPGLSVLVARMLQKKPEDRPQAMSEIEDALLQFLPDRGADQHLAPRGTSLLPLSSVPRQPGPTMPSATTLGAAAAETQHGERSGARTALKVAVLIGGLAGAGALLIKERTAVFEKRLERSSDLQRINGPRVAVAPAEALTESKQAPAPPEPAPTPPTAQPARPIEIISDPEEAEVWVTGEEASRGRTPLSIPSPDAGSVDIVLKKRGYADARLTLTAGASEPRRVTLDRLGRLTNSSEQSRHRGKVRAPESPSSYGAVGD